MFTLLFLCFLSFKGVERDQYYFSQLFGSYEQGYLCFNLNKEEGWDGMCPTPNVTRFLGYSELKGLLKDAFPFYTKWNLSNFM